MGKSETGQEKKPDKKAQSKISKGKNKSRDSKEFKPFILNDEVGPVPLNLNECTFGN